MTAPASPAIILREATGDDLLPLARLCHLAWTAGGITYDTTDVRDRFDRLRVQGTRIIVLYDGNAMLAALTAYPIDTPQGPGHAVDTFVVHPDAPDKLLLLDALTLYACNIAMSERRPIVTSRRPKTATTTYGITQVGMDAQDKGGETLQTGAADVIIARILERRPQWRLSP
jgi:hypothetical protein